MREILFRGKRVDNGEWFEGYLLKSWDDTFIMEEEECNDATSEFYCDGVVNKVIPETVGQYTGLTDKNGKKIFEGDIVKAEEFISTVNGLYRVIYDEINHCYALERDAEFHHSYFSFSALNGFHNTSCVIGNIHDNPELLGGGADA